MLSDFPVVSHHDQHQVHRLDLSMPVPARIGDWLVQQELYSVGNDFTNGFARHNPEYKGNSVLKKLWEGAEGRPAHGANRMSVWLLSHQGQAVGVVAWLRADTSERVAELDIDELPKQSNHHPKARIRAAHLGHVMCYLKKPHRGLGWIRQVLQDHVCPELGHLGEMARGQGRMPMVSAVDATQNMLAPLTNLPVVSHADMCMALRQEVWGLWRDARMYPEDPSPHDAFLVAPVAIPPPRRAPRR